MFFRNKQQIPWQAANSVAWGENLHTAEYCWPGYKPVILAAILAARAARPDIAAL